MRRRRVDESRTKWASRRSPLAGRGAGKKRMDLLREKNILDLISMGAPLPEVLNNVCTAIDLQIGNIVSVVLLPDDPECDFKTIARGALQFGLRLYWSADIPFRDDRVLGSFEMYSCVPRTPTASELKLIQRATYLAALAIRRYRGDEDGGSASREWKRAQERRSDEAAQMN
jgi:GAF domain-containing protein